MNHLYFVRHGQSTANVEGLIGGKSDWKLTAKGEQQALEAGDNALSKNLQFDVIISSPLQRALGTAKVITEKLGIDPSEIEILERIQERNFGVLEGKPESEFGVSMRHYLENPNCVDHIEDIETILQLHKRAEKVLENLKKRPEKTILLVSHAAFGRSLRKVIEGAPYDAPTENFDNAKIVKLI